MDIVEARTISLGIPVSLVRDLLDRGVSPAAILAPEGSLLGEYHGARGYAYAWGNVIETRSTASLIWHFVPVELWEQTEKLRRPTHTAVKLIPQLQPTIVESLRDHLPDELLLIGCHPRSRRHAHALFSLLVVEPARERRLRRWLAVVFLPRVLPKVLDACLTRIADACRDIIVPEHPPRHAASRSSRATRR
jgi:hypothetical protein